MIIYICHCEPRRGEAISYNKLSLRGTKEIPSLCSEQAAQSHIINCHFEERRDEAISKKKVEIATLPLVACNDKYKCVPRNDMVTSNRRT